MMAIVLIVQMTAQLLEEHRVNRLELVKHMLCKNDNNSIVVNSRRCGTSAKIRISEHVLLRPATIMIDLTDPLRLLVALHLQVVIPQHEMPGHQGVMLDPVIDQTRERNFIHV